MRKRGARRQLRLPGYLLLPQQVAIYVTPMHMALELLPLGLFTRDHANHLAMVINLVAVDAAGTGNGMWAIAQRAGDVIVAMHDRVRAGAAWNTTSDERRTLCGCIVRIDHYLRTWTSARMLIASATVDEHNAEAKARGGEFLDRVAVEEV